MNKDHNKGSGEGFSLVEVNLAILLVALGMLALFGLFPAGLREANLAMTDTHEALFADYVLSGLEANASTSSDWNVWRNMGVAGTPIPLQFQERIRKGIKVPMGSANDIRWKDPRLGSPPPVDGPVAFAGNTLMYVLEIGGTDYREMTNSVRFNRTHRWDSGTAALPPSPQWRGASLWVMSAEHIGILKNDVAGFKKIARPFHCELYYPGSMP